MDHAWLDSLSEDWISEPRSDTSAARLAALSTSQINSRRASSRESVSRIPRRSPVGKYQPGGFGNNNGNVSALNQRSSNEINIRGSQRAPSKLFQEIRSSDGGRHLSRSISASTAGSGSVVNTTVQHKSVSALPLKSKGEVPEWKRRLLYGELEYGESKDLFSSAETGLENIFRPPSSKSEAVEAQQEDTIDEATLPSSPPPYRKAQCEEGRDESSFEKSSNEFSEIPTSRLRYTRNDDVSENSSRPDDSTLDCSDHAQNVASKEPTAASSFTSLSAKHRLDRSRKTSGKSDVQNEDFSPILISRHNAGDGRVSFAPVDLPADQLRQKLDKLRQNQMLLDSEPDSRLDRDSTVGNLEHETTEDYARKGGFLNIQRGGRSADDSFRHRPLSPPLGPDSSDMLPESSLQASTPKQFPTMRTQRFASDDRKNKPSTPLSPEMPPVPHPSPEKRLQVPQANSASPLKLFGPYDTFTNQTLLRRISQFEDQSTASPSRSKDGNPKERLLTPESPSKSELNKGFLASPQKSQQSSQVHHETFGAVNKFGSGDFDGYAFNEDISINSSDQSHMDDKENVTSGDDSLPPSHPIKFDLSRASSVSGGNYPMIRSRQHRSKNSGASSKYVIKSSTSGLAAQSEGSPEKASVENSAQIIPGGKGIQANPKRDSSDFKRPRTSPSKDPTPKRRRTLHRSDIAYGLEEQPAAIESVQSTHHQMQSAMGRKRKDARQGDALETTNPTIMAMRQVLRPRTPTPSQRSSLQREIQPLAGVFSAEEATAGANDGSEIFVQDFAIDGSRKTSIKTEDFFKEANKIMAMIRSKARPKTGLSSVEESETDAREQQNRSPSGDGEDSYQDSTMEPLSRPPSREGRPVTRAPPRQEDPEVINRLRKYEEGSEMGDLISYSIRSMGLAKEAIQHENNINQSIQDSIRYSEMRHSTPPVEAEVISDLPNVRISRNPDAAESGTQAGYLSARSGSSGAFTSRSVPTGSSGGSDSRRLIVPDVVTDLIGDQVGNMVLDKEKNMWTKVKTPRPSSRGRNVLPSDDSEEDPFASIPDLSVDVTKEKQNLVLKPTPLNDLEEFLQEELSLALSSAQEPAGNGQNTDAKSMLSHTKETFTKIQQTLRETAVEDDEEIEHEITIHEDRVLKSSPSRRRNLTITFSSPLASIIQDTLPQHSDEKTNEESNEMDRSVSEIAADSLKRGRKAKTNGSESRRSTKSRSRSRSTVLSVRGQAFIPRPVSRIDEQDEDTTGERNAANQREVSIIGESSIVGPDQDDKHQTSLSFIINTPVPPKTRPTVSATPVIGKHVGTLSLSPLSDFTMNYADQSCGLEFSYVVGDNYLVTGDGSRKIMSQAIRNLVEKITEVEPFEPEWDAIRALDIKDKQLKSLHKLDEFCCSVVTLDASNNSISHLDGVPKSVRNLKITHNQLSQLTAWGHLMNLQYVDISDNQIDSLSAFKELVHLRSLRADNNQIKSLEGIKFHDGLQSLRVRGNLIKSIDFDGTKLHRLKELDLKGNQIHSFNNIEQLSCLSTLNLEDNRLSSFSLTEDRVMPSLKHLKLSNNAVSTLNFSSFPSIRLLHADRNHITTLTGIRRAQRLDSLSLREQRGDSLLDLSFLASAYEVRKLYLSGNLLMTFDPVVDFLNLQYLELANCGLQSLAEDFGQLMPNLRTLNLNFNAIGNVSALRYIPRLKKLLLAGNRLTDLCAMNDVLAEFPHLSKLDMRDNPATLGFYPSMQSLVPVDQDTEVDMFTLPNADKERDKTFAGRLDMGTKQRRRLYEIMLTQRCRRLKMSDGLVVDRIGVNRKDTVWKALLESGTISEGHTGEKESEN